MIKIIMDSGKEYDVNLGAEEFDKLINNKVGTLWDKTSQLKTGFVFIPNTNIIIRPTHISSIEII
ncbi:hypothetical protein [Clostridium beijerinckii]|uniref:Uncharacterized protein n=1 Tax=Clostridium beijerinckii TaxID=1520 RepID=A0AAX0B0S7_CLOBE|nr:hypothetical protein [Clostridium beijerinckii]NRT88557.1 hypothetical protein [Clostridium beijerinckii]NYC74012.1 hypothetical protein [Clostridium beijerinckii]